MPFHVGPTELIILMVVVMIIFGAGKLPQVGRSLGSAINEFKTSVKPEDEDDSTAKKED